jgi:hypothetical protein
VCSKCEASSNAPAAARSFEGDERHLFNASRLSLSAYLIGLSLDFVYRKVLHHTLGRQSLSREVFRKILLKLLSPKKTLRIRCEPKDHCIRGRLEWNECSWVQILCDQHPSILHSQSSLCAIFELAQDSRTDSISCRIDRTPSLRSKQSFSKTSTTAPD